MFLKQLIWRLAQKSVPMAIWLTKQWLGYRDKQEVGGIAGGASIGLSVEHEAGLDALILASSVGHFPARPFRQPISQKSVSSLVASLKIATSSASRAGVA
jgi:hypothetical protein